MSYEYAQAQAKLEVAFYYAVDEWPSLEQREVLYRSIDPGLAARYQAMMEGRKVAKERAAAWSAAQTDE